MGDLLRNVLRKITPWYDDDGATKRETESRIVVERSYEVKEKADRIVQEYILADAVYQRRNKVQT